MKVRELTKQITSYEDRTPVTVKVLIDNWWLCSFKCLRGNISNFSNRDASEFYSGEILECFNLKNILSAKVLGIRALHENEISVEVDIDEIVPPEYFEDEDEDDEYYDESLRRKKSIKEERTMPYVLWVLDGDTRQWKMYKGVDDAKQFIRDNDYDEFLDELNTQVFPNGTYYNNYIDWIVIPAGEEPRKFDTHKFYNSLKYESMRRTKRRIRL